MKDIARVISEDYNSVLYIEGKKNGSYPYSNSLLIGEYLFDTGISEQFILKLKKNHSIKHVVLSHWHEDHISGNKFFNNSFFYCHCKDKHIIEDITKMDIFYEVEGLPTIGVYEGIMNMLDLKNTKINSVFDKDEIIVIDNDVRLRIIHAPGHSAGHCCFYDEISKILFLADIDLTSFGPWYGAMDSSVIDYEQSLDKLMKLNAEVAFTSHSGMIMSSKLIREKLMGALSIIQERDMVIISMLKEKTSKSLDDFTNKNITYNTYGIMKNYELLAEKIMIQYHLNKLVNNGEVELKENGYILS
ncbi:MAG: MBL fold metallo-hydrolase [Candidatus Lokiarchaeota archaeon]|nr:MBL fold metallo-hydrolase [Candidatus Lokiarchaeota archaeon]